MSNAAATVRVEQREPVAGERAAGRAAPRGSGRVASGWESALLGLLLAVILLAPLPVGSNRPLPAALLAAAVGALALAWGVGALLGAAKPAVSARAVWPPLVLFAGAASWAAVQALPHTPLSLHHPVWAEAREALRIPFEGAISVNPNATWARLAGLLAYGGIFWLALQLGGSRRRVHQVILALAVAGLLHAAYGLYMHFSGAETVLWFDTKRIGHERVRSTFANPNSYATYAGIAMLCGLGLLARELERYTRGDRPVARAIVKMLSKADTRIGLGLLSVFLCGTALLLTLSRGAFVAICLAVVYFLLALRKSINLPTAPRLLLGATAVAVLLGILQVSGEATLERFSDAAASSPRGRLVYYLTTWEAISDRSLLGTGYGTYAEAFKAYNHPGTGAVFVNRAHNTYLQMIMELGWPAALALFLCVGYLVWRCARGLRARRRNTAELAVVVACSVLVGVHALVDFSLEMPAIAATYALLLGLGCAQALTDRA